MNRSRRRMFEKLAADMRTTMEGPRGWCKAMRTTMEGPGVVQGYENYDERARGYGGGTGLGYKAGP